MCRDLLLAAWLLVSLADAAASAEIIFMDDFELGPLAWECTSQALGKPTWGPGRLKSDGAAAWCAGSALAPGAYANGMHAVMRRAISLEGRQGPVRLAFSYWLLTEENQDRFSAFVYDGQNPSDYLAVVLARSGSSGGWTRVDVDISRYCGRPDIVIQFEFSSDGSETPVDAAGSGAYVDDLVLLAERSPLPEPHLVGPGASLPSGQGYELSWTDVPGALTYRVQESTAPDFSLADEQDLPATSARFLHHLSRDAMRYYRVAAEVSGRRSHWSNVVAVRVLSEPAAVLSSTRDPGSNSLSEWSPAARPEGNPDGDPGLIPRWLLFSIMASQGLDLSGPER